MKKIILTCIVFIPSILYAGTCIVPKEKIVVGGVALNKSVKELAKHNKAIELDNEIINRPSSKEFLVFINRKYEKTWLYGEPIEGFDFISYNKENYKIKSFGASFSFDNFSPEKYKQTLIMLYGLPKTGWRYSKENDPKYGEAVEYNYSCNEYKIRVSQSALGSSMQVSSK
ncbi:hypothetical protein C9426_00920 [Serratia sp. S1B]|nr:hypothetical protein C9426_00920 [Serratia sp. S1B]